MADEHESSRRARPAMPALPPFRGPAGAPARAPLAPVQSPDTRKAPPPFLGARPANGARPAPNGEEESPRATPPAIQSDALPFFTLDGPAGSTPRDTAPGGNGRVQPQEAKHASPETPAPASADGRISSSAVLPWLDTSGVAPAAVESSTASAAIPFPPFDSTPSEPAAPEEAAQALAGLPYFDGDGDEHEDGSPPSLRASGRMHRIEADPASVLDRVAARIRNGELRVPDVDPMDGDAATLAAVLASLLRRRS